MDSTQKMSSQKRTYVSRKNMTPEELVLHKRAIHNVGIKRHRATEKGHASYNAYQNKYYADVRASKLKEERDAKKLEKKNQKILDDSKKGEN